MAEWALEQRWESPSGTFRYDVFVGGVDGIMYALETKNGRLAWKFETSSQITSSPRAR